MRSSSITTDGTCAFQQPRIHRDTCTVVCQTGLIILVDEVLFEQGDVFICQLFTEHLLDTVCQQTTIEADISCLRQFADKSSDVLLLYVCVSIVFTACSSIGCTAIIDKEVEFFQCLTILIVTRAIEHVEFGYLIVLLGHQCHFHLVLDILHADSVVDAETR